MAVGFHNQTKRKTRKKKTKIGMGKFSKWPNKGGGPNGSTSSKHYRKKYRGQGKR